MRAWLLAAALLWSIAAAAAPQPQYDEQQLNKLIQEDADNAKAWFRLGVLQTHDGRILQAIEAFRQVIRINPNVVEPHHNLAAIYESLEDYDAAVEELKQVIALAPRDVQSQIELAGLYQKLADGIYRGIARRDPDNRVIKRGHLAQLLCRQRLAKLDDDAAMERLLARLVAPPAKGDAPVTPTTHAKAQPAPAPAKVARPSPKQAKAKVKASPVPHHQPKASPAAHHQAKAKRHPNGRPPHRVDAPRSHHHKAAHPDGKRQVLAALKAWRKAWESRNAARYFAFYSKAFLPPKWSLSLWHAHKRNVFRKAKFVRVHLSDIRVKRLDATHFQVSFDQEYQSDYYQAHSKKVVTWVKEDGAWKVLRETSVEVR